MSFIQRANIWINARSINQLTLIFDKVIDMEKLRLCYEVNIKTGNVSVSGYVYSEDKKAYTIEQRQYNGYFTFDNKKGAKKIKDWFDNYSMEKHGFQNEYLESFKN